MADHTNNIKKLNIIEKLLRKKYVSVRPSLGDAAIVEEINEALRSYLLSLMDGIFSGRAEASTKQFSDKTALVLSELASRLLNKIDKTEEVVVEGDAPPLPPPVLPNGKSPVSPVMKALLDNGYDPNAPPKERIQSLKTAREKVEKKPE